MKKLLIGVALVAAVGAACSDARQGRTQPQANELAATTVHVTATEFAFDVPEEVTGGVVEMRFTNTGGLPHEFAFARIEEGKTEADVKAVIESGEAPPNGLRTCRCAGSVARPIHHRHPDAGAGQLRVPLLLPATGGHAPRQPRDVRVVHDRRRHRVALPEPDAIITATDDGLQVPTLTSGEQTVEFENGGTKAHEMALVAFEPGKGIKDVDRWFGRRVSGRAACDLPRGDANHPGGRVRVPRNRSRAGRGVHGRGLHDGLQEEFTPGLEVSRRQA